MVISDTVISPKPSPYDVDFVKTIELCGFVIICSLASNCRTSATPTLISLRKRSNCIKPPSTLSCVDRRDVMVDPASSRCPDVGFHPILVLADRGRHFRSILLLHLCVAVLLELLERSTYYCTPLTAQRRCLVLLRNSLPVVSS
jgi:hypothetical protein